jgi:hypothetical protein
MADEIKNPLLLRLKKPFSFEGKEYEEVDLSALETWTCDDVVNIQAKFFKLIGTEISPLDPIMLESNLKYCQFVAASASGLPLEFFQRLPATNSGTLKTLVIGFFHESA